MLASCYAGSLRVADELGARSVAFPAISAGAYGWPVADAARIAIDTVRATAAGADEVRFVLWRADALEAFRVALDARLGW